MGMKPREIVKHLMHQGRGLLALDEDVSTLGARLTESGIESTEETRRAYHELLLTAPDVEKMISGVVFSDELIRQPMSDGTPFPDFAMSRNMYPGISIDLGLSEDTQFEGGEVTMGLDGLRERLLEYRALGAVFTNWRSAINVGLAGSAAMRENASRMAAYAQIVLTEGLVPVLELNVLMNGAHTPEQAERVTTEALSLVIDALHSRDIDLSHLIIRTSMVLPGVDCPMHLTPTEVATHTVRSLTTALPEEVGAVAFISNDQPPEDVTANFNAISRTEPLPWPVTFIFSNALHASILSLWQGQLENREAAHAAFNQRLSLFVAADGARYVPALEDSSLQSHSGESG